MMKFTKQIITATALLMATQVSAATTGNLLLKGIVPELLSITVSAETIASTLPLQTTQSDTKVATINEKSNSNTGYKVSIASSNLGNLVHDSVSSSSVAYSLTYDGNAVDLANGDDFTFSTAGSVDANKDVDISYTGTPLANLIEGNYTDTVTFTISAN